LDWSTLREDYERLGTQAAVAKEYGCRQQLVQKAMKRLGIPAKPVKGRTYTWTEERRTAHKAAVNTPEFKEAHRRSLITRYDTLRGSATDSPLEALLHGALKRAGLSFTTQRGKLGRYVVDIELHQAPVIIEADGFSHRLDRRKARDADRDADLIEAGYRIHRFTGTEINADPDACIRTVIEAEGLTPDTAPAADIRRGGRGPENPNWKGAQIEHTCSHCGVTFIQHRANRTYAKTFCNQKCYGAWMLAHPEASPVHARWAKARQAK
jgi:very-short-patch-repair endonuclease